MSLVSGKQYSTEITSRKNMIINGAMDIWQRGTSLAMDNQVSAYLLDRFICYNDRSTGAATQLQSTDVPTVANCGIKLNYSWEFDITTALATPSGSNEATLRYTVEGYDYAKISGKNITISFWVKSNKTGTYALAFRNFAAGQTQRRTYTIEYTIDIADTWEKKTFVVPMTGADDGVSDWDYTNGQGLNIDWCFMSASGYASTSTFNEWQDGNTPYTNNQTNLFDNTANYFRLAAVQFEAGIEATDFEKRHIADELQMCQRYYCKTGEINNWPLCRYSLSSGVGYNQWQFPVEMRDAPAFTASGTWTATSGFAGTPILQSARTSEVTIRSTTSPAANAIVYADGGQFIFDAEL